MVDIVTPRRGESIVDNNGVPTKRFFKYLEGSTTQSNNTVSITEIDSISINSSSAKTGEINRRTKDIDVLLPSGIDPQISYLLSKDFKVDEYASNHTVTTNEVVICTAEITVTLTGNFIGQRCYIKRTNGVVTILGTIDNATNVILNTENSAVTLVYTASGWWII